jgi:DNA-binding transcriptional MocR family regulator
MRSIDLVTRLVRGTGFQTPHSMTGGDVQLPEWLQASDAWATLKPGPRALYIELKRRFNGTNNGRIIFSHRDAASALHVHRNTVGPWFDELQARGFVFMTHAPHLGPAGIGKASIWALGELPTDDMKPAQKAFMRWSEKQNPRTKNRTPRHSECDTPAKMGAKQCQAS